MNAIEKVHDAVVVEYVCVICSEVECTNLVEVGGTYTAPTNEKLLFSAYNKTINNLYHTFKNLVHTYVIAYVQ